MSSLPVQASVVLFWWQEVQWWHTAQDVGLESSEANLMKSSYRRISLSIRKAEFVGMKVLEHLQIERSQEVRPFYAAQYIAT